MNVVFVKQYDVPPENQNFQVPLLPIKMGHKGVLIDDINGIIEIIWDGDIPIRLEGVPPTYYGEARDDI